MAFTLSFDTDNDAFAQDLEGEVRNILSGVAHRILSGTFEDSVKDTNGNTVGSYALTNNIEDAEDAEEVEDLEEVEE